MANSEIIAYIKNSQSKKLPDDQIKKNLTQTGWDTMTIEEAFKAINTNDYLLPPSGVPLPPKAASYAGGWDAFEHILMFITLYSVALSIGLILHQLVDRLIPGINEYGYLSDFTEYILQGAIAALIVTLPLFIFFHLDVNKRTLKNPSLRNFKVRRVFIYITLFYTFCHMVTKLVTTIYTFLQGNVGFNFIFHTIITLSITGTIFAYYLYQVKEDRKLYA